MHLHYLKDGMECEAVFYDGKSNFCRIAYNYCSSSYLLWNQQSKATLLVTFLKMQNRKRNRSTLPHRAKVPLFVNQDDIIGNRYVLTNTNALYVTN